MNSFSMYKKFVSILICVLLSAVFFTGCSHKAVYRTQSMKYVIDGKTAFSYSYTYTSDNKPAIIIYTSENEYNESYIDVFGYNENGEMVSYSRKFDSTIEENYTAEKITDNKYIFRDSEGKEYLTIIFDRTGFIVSRRYTSGYVTEYAFTYDKNGKPVSFKKLEILPSGSNRITEYTTEFIDSDTYRMKSIGENAIENAYYEVDCTIIK